MNLIIDQGNSVCKVAVVDAGEFIAHYSFPQVSLREAGSILSDYPDLQAAIYSSVAGVDKLLLSLLAERIPTVLRVDEYIDVPVRVRYDRKGLGSDRLAAVVGASALAPQGVSLLVVDLGTAITFEQITPNGEYIGGNISPGLYTRLKALNHFTSRLPLLHDLVSPVRAFGTTTAEAISSGVLHGVVHEIKGYIDEAKANDPQVQVFVTGGDASLIESYLPQEVRIEPDLVLYGLNKILEYNR